VSIKNEGGDEWFNSTVRHQNSIKNIDFLFNLIYLMYLM
jgi:hypothetical protein